MTESDATGPGDGRCVTSITQAGQWFLDRLVDDPRAHRLHRAYDVMGVLDIDALTAAWRHVHARHEILRTRLVADAGVPVPTVSASADVAPVLVELGPHTSTERALAVDRISGECVAAPLDLAAGPVCRLFVVRLSGAQHRLVLVAHRAAVDESSASILIDELARAYRAALDGRPPDVVGPPTQYTGFTRWQRGRLAGGAFDPLLGWWRAALTPLPRSDAPAADRTVPTRPVFDGGLLPFDWASGPGSALAELSDRTGVATELVPLAGLLCLLYRHDEAGRPDDHQRVGVCVPVAARPGPAADDVVGPFGNQIVIGVDMSADLTFRRLLLALSARARDAFAHAELPFDLLPQALRLDRDPRRHPICEVWYRFPDRTRSELRLPYATVRPAQVHTGFVEADLVLSVDRITPTVAGTLAYSAARYDRDTARLLLDQLHALLAAAPAGLDRPVGELPLEAPHRTDIALLTADQLPTGPPIEPVHHRVRRWAKRAPHAPAVSWPGSELSYRRLDEHAGRIAGALRGLGAGVDTAVAVSIASGPSQVAALLGVGYAGAQLVCLDADTGQRAQAVLADVRPVGLVVDGTGADDTLVGWYRSELGGRVLDLARLDAEPGRPVGPFEPARSSPQDLAYVAYTSGSTGRPKGIPQTHATLAQFVDWLAGQFGIGPGARMAQWAAAGYDASLCEVFAALGAGATLCPVPGGLRMHPEKLVGWLAEERITHFQTVPSFARELLKAIRRNGPARLPYALRWLLLAGEALPGELANDLRRGLPGVRLANLYGPTESILATWCEVDADLDRTAPIGWPIPGRRVVVLDEADRPCPTGVTGELVIVSPYLTAGYLGVEPDERSPFRPLCGPAGVTSGCERVYRTGDLGRRRPDGSLEFRGRRDLQVKFYGTRLELTDIEAALAAHESVADCAVVALTDRHGLVSRLVACVVPVASPDGRTAGGPEVWRQHLYRRVGRAKLPVSFRTVDAFARNVGGKVDRRALMAAIAPAADSDAAPRTAAEKAIAAIWSQLVGVELPGRHDTFFSIGGHSLQVPRAVARIRERFGIEMTLSDFFANASLADLSALVQSAARTP
ncbi:amino acid adenylation domain-containing protein [Solwaraspora sp. WMMD791]|uniref:non-ribosomal peptide synthetase n=1 Tax=Solwaraspora sp. WMMD791 TaxID=3016086 RepID=UPI00249A6BF2|nr:amino acid adenylation domain-containing protein [Solwaraspora sp. WMMD791]WFE29249.1 amino acid adenylation domain-containing protein [Solwaraspora sp. WMMD791]